MLPEIRADFDRISSQIALADCPEAALSGELKSVVYEHICVVIVGRLEQNIKTIFVTYANNKSNRKIGHAMSRLCQSFQNPSKSKIIDLISLFDDEFAAALKADWEAEDSVGNTISDMVGKRKRIAHQTSNRRDVTRTKVLVYFDAYKKLITLLDNHFLK